MQPQPTALCLWAHPCSAGAGATGPTAAVTRTQKGVLICCPSHCGYTAVNMSELIYLRPFFQGQKQGKKTPETKGQELIWTSRLCYTHLLGVLRKTQPNPSLWAPRNSKSGWNLALWCQCTWKTTPQVNTGKNLHQGTWVRVKWGVGCMSSADTKPCKGWLVARCLVHPKFTSHKAGLYYRSQSSAKVGHSVLDTVGGSASATASGSNNRSERSWSALIVYKSQTFSHFSEQLPKI